MPLKTVEITGALYPAIVEVNQGPQGPPGTVGDVEWNDLTGTVDVVPFTTTNGGPVNKGELAWTQEDETLTLALSYGTMLQLGEEIIYHVDNQTGTNIANGTPVMYAGTVGNSGRMRVKPWDGTDPMAYMGIATSLIATGASGYVTHFGKVRGIQTNGANYGETWVNGDIIYTKTGSAGLTKTKPTSGNYAVVAAVISAHASNGTLFVRRSVERNIVSADIGDATNLATPNTVARRDSSGICSFSAIRLPSGSKAGTFSVGAPLSGNFSYTAPNASGVIALTSRTDGVPDNINPASAKTTPIDADEVIMRDSTGTPVAKRLTFANLWTWISGKINNAVVNAAIADDPAATREELSVYSTSDSDAKLTAAQLALLDPDAAAYQAAAGIDTADAADVSAFLAGLNTIGVRSSLVDAGIYQSRFQPTTGTAWKSLLGTADLTSTGSPTRHRNGVLFSNDDHTSPTTPQRLHGNTPTLTGVWTIVTVSLRDRAATTASGQRRAFNAYQTAAEGGLALAVQMQNASNWSNYTFAGGVAANINGPQLPAEYRWRLNAMTNANPSGATSFSSDVLTDSTAKQETTGRGNVPIRHLAIGAGTTDGSTFAQYFDGMVPLWMIFDSVLTDAQLIKIENLVNRTIARRVKWVFDGDSISTSAEGWPWGLQTASEWLGRNIELKEVGLGGETTIGAAARIGKQGCRLFLNAVVPLDGETVILNGETYTWKNTLSAARHVKIGASVSDCLANFKAAINGEAGEGTLYGTGTTANTTFSAVLGPAASLYLLLDAGDPAVSVSETMTNGFLRNQISQNITTTELMGLHSSIRDPLHPTWCLIQCGSNDPGDTANWQATFANLQSLWAAARAAGLKVVATTMPGATTFSGFWNGASGDTIEQGRASLNAAIRAASSEYDALLDVDSLLTADGGAMYWTDPAILVDGVHPSTASRKAIMNDLWILVGSQMP